MSRTLLSLLFLHELFHETAQPQTPSWDYALTKSSMRLLIHELYHVNVTNSTISTTNSPMRLLIHELVHQSTYPRPPSWHDSFQNSSIPYHELFNETTLSRTLSCEYHGLYHLRPSNIEKLQKRPSNVGKQCIGFDCSLPTLLLVVSR